MQFFSILVPIMASFAIATPTAVSPRGGGSGGGSSSSGGGGSSGGSGSSSGGGSSGEGSDYVPCSGLYNQANCCDVAVLGVADLNCATVSETPKSADDFESICATTGQEAQCCVLDLLSQSLLCATPVGL